jgi:hypothetical protein
MRVNTTHRRVTEQVSDISLMNSIGSQPRREGVTSIVESKIHESCLLASVPPACLNGINVHTSSSIAEHEIFWSSILLDLLLQ